MKSMHHIIHIPLYSIWIIAIKIPSSYGFYHDVSSILSKPRSDVLVDTTSRSCSTSSQKNFQFTSSSWKNVQLKSQSPSSTTIASRTRSFLRMSDNQQNTTPTVRQYFATCIPGLSNVLSKELTQLGAYNIQPSGDSGVSFTSNPFPADGDLDIGMKALLWLRTCHKLMELVISSTDYYQDEYSYKKIKIRNKEDLYQFVKDNTPIQSLLGNGKGGLLTLSVQVIINGRVPKEMCHSHYTALTVKNALVDKVRELREDGIRPDVDLYDADVPLVLVLKGDERTNAVDVSLYRVLHSGGSLHRRGYRLTVEEEDDYDDYSGRGLGGGKIHKAAMKESLAAGLLMEAGYDLLVQAAKTDNLPCVLVDPMAGSATFCLEAAMIASDYAPGLMRIQCHELQKRRLKSITQDMNENDVSFVRNPHSIPPIVRWKDTDLSQWKELLLDCKSRASAGMKWMQTQNKKYPDRNNCVILGNEINPNALSLAESNVRNAGMSKVISLFEGDCSSWNLGGKEYGHDDGNYTREREIIPGRTIIVTNPPWGLRLTEDVEQSWEKLKLFFREECYDAEAWVLSGSKDATRFLRMKKSRSVPIRTGAEDLRWIQYHVFGKKSDSGVDSKDHIEVDVKKSKDSVNVKSDKNAWY